jgi:hypothetical protein
MVEPREHPVPCQLCGLRTSGRRITPVTMTMNNSALCDRHEREEALRLALVDA